MKSDKACSISTGFTVFGSLWAVVLTVTSLCNGYSAASLGVRPDILSGTINALFSEISE